MPFPVLRADAHDIRFSRRGVWGILACCLGGILAWGLGAFWREVCWHFGFLFGGHFGVGFGGILAWGLLVFWREVWGHFGVLFEEFWRVVCWYFGLLFGGHFGLLFGAFCRGFREHFVVGFVGILACCLGTL